MENDNFENEIWLPIADYPNYQISNYGRVKSLNYKNTRKELLLKQYLNHDKYFKVYLYKNKNRIFFYTHRLVAQTFIPNPNKFIEVNHIDENTQNNYVNNLEWCDRKYNNNYGTHNENVSKSLINHQNLSKQVNQYNLAGNFIKTWKSTMEIERQLGFYHSAISRCCNGKDKSAYGYIWRYV